MMPNVNPTLIKAWEFPKGPPGVKGPRSICGGHLGPTGPGINPVLPLALSTWEEKMIAFECFMDLNGEVEIKVY